MASASQHFSWLRKCAKHFPYDRGSSRAGDGGLPLPPLPHITPHLFHNIPSQTSHTASANYSSLQSAFCKCVFKHDSHLLQYFAFCLKWSLKKMSSLHDFFANTRHLFVLYKTTDLAEYAICTAVIMTMLYSLSQSDQPWHSGQKGSSFHQSIILMLFFKSRSWCPLGKQVQIQGRNKLLIL